MAKGRESAAVQPAPAGADLAATEDVEKICGCFDLSLGQIKQAIDEHPDLKFEQFLDLTGAGSKCTACLLDLEYHFVSHPRPENRSTTNTKTTRAKRDSLPLKQRVYRVIDKLSPDVPIPLPNQLPVIAGEGIEQWLWLSNHSLLFEGETSGSEMDVDLVVRDATGREVHKTRLLLGEENLERINISGFLQDTSPVPGAEKLRIGSVEVVRRGRQPGVRGTTRPQIEIIGTDGVGVVHGQAAGRVRKGGFTCLYRPDEEEIFFTILNAGNADLPVKIQYPVGAADVPKEQRVVDELTVAPMGTSLYRLNLPEGLRARFENKPLQIQWHTEGLRKIHVICANKSLTSFSIDHL